jgi:large subunit ribosomal protein L20
MNRVKRGTVARVRRQKVLSLRKHAKGSNSYLFRMAQQHVIKSLSFSYRGRRERKRHFRSRWNLRLNASLRYYGWNYSSFIYYQRQKKCLLNRKVLAQICLRDVKVFENLCNLMSIFYKNSKFNRNCNFNAPVAPKSKTSSIIERAIDYKNANLLRHYISPTRKIIPRHTSKLTLKHHAIMSKSIRRSRTIRILPFVWLTF